MRSLTPLGMEVKKRLIEKGMTHQELARRLGTSTQYLNAILYGDRSGEKYLVGIQNILGIGKEEDNACKS